MSLIQIVYASVATQPFSSKDLQVLMEESRARNEEHGVTGILLYHQESFLQALEGPAGAIEQALARIRRDPRHQSLLLLLENEVAEREFGQHGLVLIDAQDLSENLRDALAPVLFRGVGLDDSLLASGRAHRLMQTFARVAG